MLNSLHLIFTVLSVGIVLNTSSSLLTKVRQIVEDPGFSSYVSLFTPPCVCFNRAPSSYAH